MRRKLRAASVLFAASLMVSGAWAQFTLRSNITGLITDPSDSIIPSVTVTLTDLDRNQTFTTQTNEAGLYLFSNVNPGRYQVSVEPPGFRKTVSAPMDVSAQQTARRPSARAWRRHASGRGQFHSVGLADRTE